MKKNKYNDTWIYTLLLTSLTILYISINKYNYTYYEISFPYSYLLIPIMFYIINYLSNRKIKDIIFALLISILLTYIYNIVLYFSLGGITPLKEITYLLIPIFFSEIINYFLFKYLNKHTREGYILILLNYLLSFIIFMIIKSIININSIVNTDYYINYLLIVLIELVLIIIMSAIDKIHIRKSK